MTLPESKMPHLHILLLLLLFLLLPQSSQAATASKPRSDAFWRKFCGFFCPYQRSCDSNVYLSSQQQLDLLNSQEFLDILELFPQILLENEKLQHTTLVRLEDHQRDLILLRYKDFFHPRETLPLARQKIVRQFAKHKQGFEGVPIPETPTQGNTEPNEIHLTEDQVQELIRKTAGVDNNQVHQDAPQEQNEDHGTPDWNGAEGFIRDYVNQQRIHQSKKKHLKDNEAEPQTSSDATIRRDSTVALDINQLQDERRHLNVDQILKEVGKMGHSFDPNNPNPDEFQDLDEIHESESELQRTKESDPPVLNQDESETGEMNDNSNCTGSKHKEPSATNVNRISDKKSKNSKEPFSDSYDARTLQEHFYRHQTNLPSKQQITQELGYLNSPASSQSNSIPSARRTSKNRRSSLGSLSGRRQIPGQHHPDVLVHEPGWRVEEEDRGSQRMAKRHSRSKREVFRMQVCPVLESWSNMVLAETVSGTLIQIAQFPEVNLEQWFLHEQCLYQNSPIIRGVTCEIRERLVDAVIIPVVDPTQPIQTTKIKIDSCISVYNLEL